MGFLTGCANPQSGDAVSPHGLYRNWQPVPNDAPTSNRADVSRAGAWARNLDRFSGLRMVRTGEGGADHGRSQRGARSSPTEDYQRVRELMAAGKTRDEACIQTSREVSKSQSTIETNYYIVRRRLGIGAHRHHPARESVAPQANADYQRVTALRMEGTGVVLACRIVAAETGRLERSVQQSYYRGQKQRRQLGVSGLELPVKLVATPAPEPSPSPGLAQPVTGPDRVKEAQELAADIELIATDLVREVWMAVSRMQTEAAEVEDITSQLAALRSSLA